MPRRPELAHLAFFGILLVAIPTAYYHFASGRYAQAMMAIGASIAGMILAREWARRRRRGDAADPDEPQVVAVPPLPRGIRRRPGLRWTPRSEWLRNGAAAGLIASIVMALTLVGCVVLAANLQSSPARATVAAELVVGGIGPVALVVAAPFESATLQLALGIAFALVYAGFAEPLLGGPDWLRGLVCAAVLWVLSATTFLPAMGGGAFGLSLGAGPIPALASAAALVAYGLTLSAVYSRLASKQSDRNEARGPASSIGADLGGTVGLGGGALVGAGCGALMEAIGGSSVAVPPPVLTAAGAVVGAAWGVLLGSIAASGASAPLSPSADPADERPTPLQRER